MDKQHVLAAWIAGGLIWLGALGAMAMMDDGVPPPHLPYFNQMVEHAPPTAQPG